MVSFNNGCLKSGLWRWAPRTGLHCLQRCAHLWSQELRSYGCLILSNYFTFESILEKATSKLEKKKKNLKAWIYHNWLLNQYLSVFLLVIFRTLPVLRIKASLPPSLTVAAACWAGWTCAAHTTLTCTESQFSQDLHGEGKIVITIL